MNQQSIKTRVTINDFMEKNQCVHKVTIKEIDYEQEKDLSNNYGVMGTPAVLLLKNGILLKRHFGEITSNELESLFDDVSNL
jgi:hypothetical protein